MSKKQQPPEIHDEDLRQIFRNQPQDHPPADLDQRILLAASRSLEQKTPEDHKVRTDNKFWQRGLAVAALLVLSVSLVPILNRQQNPEFQIPQSMENRGEVAVPDLRESAAVPASPGMSADTAMDETADFLRSAPAPSTLVAPQLKTEPAVPAAKKLQRSQTMQEKAIIQAPAAAGFSEAESVAEKGEEMLESDEDIPAYRENPQSWLAFIESLEEAGETDRADRERVLFEKAFPGN